MPTKLDSNQRPCHVIWHALPTELLIGLRCYILLEHVFFVTSPIVSITPILSSSQLKSSKMDAGLGIEPTSLSSKLRILPLDDPAILVRWVGFEPTSPGWKPGSFYPLSLPPLKLLLDALSFAD